MFAGQVMSYMIVIDFESTCWETKKGRQEISKHTTTMKFYFFLFFVCVVLACVLVPWVTARSLGYMCTMRTGIF